MNRDDEVVELTEGRERDLVLLFAPFTENQQCHEWRDCWMCSRPVGHPGPHVSHRYGLTVAVWPVPIQAVRKLHRSDCAMHNMPALPASPCDCEASS